MNIIKKFLFPWLVFALLIPSFAFGWGEVTRPQLGGTSPGYGVDMVGNGVKTVSTIADLKAIDVDKIKPRTVYLFERGGGLFVWTEGDLSVKVSSDPLQGVYVAPASSSTGAGGAWVRDVGDCVLAEWFGLSESGAAAENSTALNAAEDLAVALGLALNLPSGSYTFDTWEIDEILTIVGSGKRKTYLLTAALSGSAISLSGTDPRGRTRFSISGFTLATNGGGEAVDIGLDISGALGVYPGAGLIENIECYGFQKAGAIALYIDNASHLSLSDSSFSTNSGYAAKIDGTLFNTGVFSFSNVIFGSRLTDTVGLWIAQGSAIDSLHFSGCYFAGTQAALKIGNGNNTVRSLSFTGCHFENSTLLAGNALVEFAGGSGVGAIGVDFAGCTFGGFGVAESAFKFNSGYYYNINVLSVEVQNIASTGYVVNNISSLFKNCRLQYRSVTTSPTDFSSVAYTDSGAWLGGWLKLYDGYENFERLLKVGGKRVIVSAVAPVSNLSDGDLWIDSDKTDGAPLYVRESGLWIGENTGAASIGDGGTIEHGLGRSPSSVLLTGSVAGEIVTVTGVDAVNITVAIKDNGGATGTAQNIYWMAR